MRISLPSFVALALLAVGPVACSSETDPVENDEEVSEASEVGKQSEQAEQAEQAEQDDVQVEVTESQLSPRAGCGTYCTRTNYGSIACNLTTYTGKTTYTCRTIYGSSYNTGCVPNRGASYCLSYF